MSRADFQNSRHFYPMNYVIRSLIVYLKEMFKLNNQLDFMVCDEDAVTAQQNLSGLLITDQNAWETAFRGHMPSIVVRRGNAIIGGGIQSGDMSRVVSAGFNLPTSVMEILSVPVVLSCIARQDLEAEALAVLISGFIHDDKRWAHSFGIYGIVPPQISPVQIMDTSQNGFICSVSSSVSISRKYDTRPLSDVKLQEIALYVNQNPTAKIN